MNFIHPSVLVNEVLENLVKNENGTYWDATCGGGGHSFELLSKYPNIKIIASDWDLNAIKATERRLEPFSDRYRSIYGNMGHIETPFKRMEIKQVDGILADFGTSRNQIMNEDGFSFMKDTYLDMRMSKGMHKKKAADILNYASEKELAFIFYEYGQEKNSKKFARCIVEERKENKFKTTFQLSNFIKKITGYKGKLNPATKVFQALRIAVNDELKEIKSFLHHLPSLIKKDGRVCCISFHSLEDVLVKDFMKSHKVEFKDIVPGVIIPTEKEVKINLSSRSAKLRVLQKL